MEWVDTLMQWLHLVAAVTLIGAAIYIRKVAMPALAGLQTDARNKLVTEMLARMRPLAFAAIVVLVGTGLYNYMTRMVGRPPAYHMILGVKMLLALHVFTVMILLLVPPGVNPGRDARRPRLLMGAVISGLIILLISAHLRRNF
jgi:uncharacterized membrane protein